MNLLHVLLIGLICSFAVHAAENRVEGQIRGPPVLGKHAVAESQPDRTKLMVQVVEPEKFAPGAYEQENFESKQRRLLPVTNDAAHYEKNAMLLSDVHSGLGQKSNPKEGLKVDLPEKVAFHPAPALEKFAFSVPPFRPPAPATPAGPSAPKRKAQPIAQGDEEVRLLLVILVYILISSRRWTTKCWTKPTDECYEIVVLLEEYLLFGSRKSTHKEGYYTRVFFFRAEMSR